jgi:hypothetical protein
MLIKNQQNIAIGAHSGPESGLQKKKSKFRDSQNKKN